jgi:hypothetical protein
MALHVRKIDRRNKDIGTQGLPSLGRSARRTERSHPVKSTTQDPLVMSIHQGRRRTRQDIAFELRYALWIWQGLRLASSKWHVAIISLEIASHSSGFSARQVAPEGGSKYPSVPLRDVPKVNLSGQIPRCLTEVLVEQTTVLRLCGRWLGHWKPRPSLQNIPTRPPGDRVRRVRAVRPAGSAWRSTTKSIPALLL